VGGFRRGGDSFGLADRRALFRWRQAGVAYLYLAPALFLLLFIYAYPLLQLVRLSTQKVITYQNTLDVGLANFRALLVDPAFRLALLNNLRLLLAVPILIALAVVFAAVLHEQLRGWRLYRALAFLPYVLAVPVVGVAFGHLLRLNGPANQMLRSAGLDALALDWLGDPRVAPWTLLAVIVWKELGFGIILFLARLLSARPDLYEAAALDGAGWWQRLRHVSLPELRSVIEFYAILEVITMVSWVFAYVYTMTGGGPANSTVVLEFYVYRKAFGIGAGGRQIGVAAAVSVVMMAGLFLGLGARSLLRRARQDPA
jgi:ABC-type sugar transport system permease subunit